MKKKFILLICAFLGFRKGATAARSVNRANNLKFKTVNVDGVTIFYREAGDPDKPTILLLHGFPSTSYMYDALMSNLATNYHLIAPDYPGFGNSSQPEPGAFI